MANPSLVRLFENLKSRSESGDELAWERPAEHEFALRLINPPIAIVITEDDSVEPPGYHVLAESTQGDVDDPDRSLTESFQPDQEGYTLIHDVAQAAKQRFVPITELLEQGADALENDTESQGLPEESPGEPIKSENEAAEWAKSITGEGDDSRHDVQKIELVPPTDEQVRSFFARIKGNWKRHHEQGFDDLTIDESGDVYYRITAQGKTLVQSPKPAFRLVLIACTPEFEKVELSREAVNGTSRQIEVLRITENEMIGHAKHDNQLLQYRCSP